MALGRDTCHDLAPAGTPSQQTAVALQLAVPLFAGGATAAQQERSTYTRESQIALLEGTRREIIRNVETQWRAMRGSLMQIASAEVAAQAAERALAATRAGQQYGTRSLSDVLIAIQTNGQAQLALIQARHRHVLALLLLEQAAGHLSEDGLAAANSLLEQNDEKCDTEDN